MTLHLLCDAIPFCYGPAAALETLLQELCQILHAPYRVDVLASGTTLEFLERSQLPISLLPLDSEDPVQLATLDLSPYTAFLAICNPVSFRAVQTRGLASAYLDFLLWMHSGPPGDHFGAHLYLAENYPGTTEWVRDRGGEIPNLVLVPPLIQAPLRRSARGMLLVGLGGMFSRLTIPGVNTNYANYVVRELLTVLEPTRFAKVVIAGPTGLAPLLHPLLARHPRAEFHSLSHGQFLAALAECEAFLSHPGLYAPFEAMLSGVPTAFLPPSNYTQLLQLRHFRACGMADRSFSWDDLRRDLIVPDLPEPAGVAAVLAEISAAECSEAATIAFRAMLSDFLSLDARALEELGSTQRTAASAFYGRGPRLAAEHVSNWLRSLSDGSGL
jgi:hypothetical protein